MGACSWLWRNKKNFYSEARKGVENEKFSLPSFPLFFRLKVETENVKNREKIYIIGSCLVRLFAFFLRALFASFFCVCCIFSSTVFQHFLFYSVRLSASLLLCLSSFISFSPPAAPFAHISKALPSVWKNGGKERKRENRKKSWIANDVVNSSEFGSTFLFIGESMNRISHMYTLLFSHRTMLPFGRKLKFSWWNFNLPRSHNYCRPCVDARYHSQIGQCMRKCSRNFQPGSDIYELRAQSKKLSCRKLSKACLFYHGERVTSGEAAGVWHSQESKSYDMKNH